MLIEPENDRWKRFAVSGILFVLIAAMIKEQSMILQLVDSVFQSLFTNPNWHNHFVHMLMTLVSFLGSPKMDLLWMLVIAFFLWGFKLKIPALWTICTVVGGDALGWIVKHIVKRARPVQHMAKDDGYSFPSGHVLGFFLVVAVLMLIVVPLIHKRATRVICQILLVLAVLVLAISRVYLWAHYPVDTIG
ncbi:MAG TPA: phosphatase PAP2 family protein, partial [Candidatus Limosilactobacillus merdipullorum]|nr:phosphatase PAP2 family protein [Candidatus Limosilactobacillus merdipullorum]